LQDKATGAFGEAWSAALAASELPVVDVSAAVGTLLSIKDEDEVKNVRKAAYLVSSAMNNRGVRDIEGERGVVDGERERKCLGSIALNS
jgi:Xaa-Pro aminopeptidase